MKSNENLMVMCPIPINDYPHILLAHGGGGKLMNQLVDKMFLPVFGNSILGKRHDGATIELSHSKIAMTTDSYVVHPIFFPGGDIATLAVNGTVNDLAMCGATPLYLSISFILEEGFPMETLWQVVQSLQKAAEKANIQIITGDTKVVDRGKGDGIFINTTGIGSIGHSQMIGPTNVQPGDLILLNGDIGRHGIAIMSVREGLVFESPIESDTLPLTSLVSELLSAGIKIHCMRDLTRGGLAGVLNEIAQTACLQIRIEENLIPVRGEVESACEILGLDPLYVANEGRFVAFIPRDNADRALSIMSSHPDGQGCSIIGKVEKRPEDDPSGLSLVIMKSKIGANRIVDMLSGEQLPRIC